jgi:hypothetical protein
MLNAYPSKDALLQGGLDGLQAELQRKAKVRAEETTSVAQPPSAFNFILDSA